MNYNNLKFELENEIAVITFDQPKSMNALKSEVFVELLDAIHSIKTNNLVRALIITGNGKAFVAGADISEMSEMGVMEAKERINFAHNCFREIENLDIPVIAAINGYALGGGCELALACDIRIAAKEAKFGQPEVNLGIIPCYGGTQRLPRLIGKGNAMNLILTGELIDATEAYRIGLIQKLVDSDQLMEAAKDIAEIIKNKGPVAIKVAKQVINKGVSSDIDIALAYEETAGSLLFSTKDQKEGMKAFLEKRKPEFVGR